LNISIECKSPKYAKGTYNYTKLEDVFNFLVSIRGFPRGKIGHWLLNVAKDGIIHGVYTARYGLKIESDFHDYELAQKIAEETGLTQPFDRVSPNMDVALSFAESFDRKVR
jgi:hypothetical protein